MRLRKSKLAAACALALSSMAFQAGAQAPDEAAPVADESRTVRVAGHYDNAVGTSDAASQGVITSELIVNRPALRTGELLEFVPGLIVTQHSGDGKANQYFLRGFNLDHGTDFAMYVDGMPVNMRTHAHGQGYSDLNFLIPELVQRIDYKKGPYFAGEGDFASAGAARIRLADKLPQGQASMSVGQHGYVRGVLADSIDAGPGTLLVGLEVNRNNGPWDVPERVRKVSGVLRYSQGTQDDGFSVTAMAYKNSWNATDQVPLRAVASGQIGRFGSLAPSDGGDTSRTSLSYAQRRRTENRLFEFDAYVIRSQLELNSDFTYFLAKPAAGDQFQQSERRTVAGVNASESWNTQLAGLALRNKLGVQARFDRLSPVGLYDTVERIRQSTVREDRVRESSLGLYAENTAQWLPWLRSVAGLRYDAYRFKVASSIEGNSGTANDQVVSPKLSLILGPWSRTEFFVNYGKGFHSNDARGTTQTRLPDGEASTPVTPLVPTKGMELGARTEWLPGLQSSLALWRLDIASELLFVGDAGETQPSRASRRHGIEWNNHYIAAPWLLFDLDLAASRSRYTENDAAGNYIPGSIDRVASFGVTVTDQGPWSGAFQLRYFGPRPLIEDNSVRSASTTLAYARVAYQLNRRTRLSLDVFNLLNKRASDIDYYYASRLPGEAADGVSDRHFHPVEPRSVRLTLAYAF
ncbi:MULTISPECIES: TonB-dependent receptor [unclassified Janthinobacterium]|uniref:TonB-dependent receptor n=1 Tax=unclassified Janthinobacterium TaxID=2610881 RepID=UPI00088CD77F|nr:MULTISPECIES: TonB-dependent receptor [unclassified Janthinobacterium]SDA59593.1 Outer membrane receptor proteins, mostly Fe transport [Janthinobacterium sp. 551a]SFB32319.1 Outer membrane receptor proteins, mostly Fe transport [Janthinobacterium sp. 344]